MKNTINHSHTVLSLVCCAVVLFLLTVPLHAQPSSEISPKPVLDVMQRVADWQLANPSKHPLTDWTQGAGDAGFMALAGISGDAKYREAMRAMGATNDWKLGPHKFYADDHCVGQTYAELYFLYREPKLLAPLQARFDEILARAPTNTSLDFSQKGHGQDRWSWCDSLFMAPPAWVRLYAATGDEKYLDFAVKEWWRTTGYLYDTNEHLFYRDSTYFKKVEANGKKVFWSRGNGWVLGGLVRVMQYLPMNHPDRPRFEQLFKDMSAKILTCQQADGLWRASLLDPESYPLKETSGSGFYTYALAWGVNQGLLDRAQFEPAVRKAWAALVSCVDADGKLTHVQPIGADPKKFAEDSTEVYGVGAFLLAGSEVYRLAIIDIINYENNRPHSPQEMGASIFFTVTVKNPSDFYRESETVEIELGKEKALFPKMFRNSLLSQKPAVMDGLSSHILDTQLYFTDTATNPTLVKILFQIDLAPKETRKFMLFFSSGDLPAIPPPIVKTMARYVPERFDDFAWESDRIAHRIYGQALIKAEGTISSGADVWIKKDRGLIVDEMYRTKHYHADNGAFMDDYRVGKSRGCGGLGIWDGKKLFTSGNYRNWKLITSGPIRSEFELTYDAWDAGGGRMVSETKRFSIDAGSWLTKVSSTMIVSEQNKSLPLTVGVGLAERACPTNREEFITHDLTEGWMTYWQPEDQPKGTTAVAVLLPKNSVKEFTNDNPSMPDSVKHANVPQPTHEGYPPIRNQLAITKAEIGRPLTYYFGASWDRSGDFTNHVQWENYVKRFAERRDQPLQVGIGN